MLRKYGVKHSSKIPAVLEKRKKTMLKNYGVDHSFKLPSTRANAAKALAERTNSKEMKLGKLLETNYKEVKPQYLFEKWRIDFYLSNEDVYIELNGNFWHGHNHTEEELGQMKMGPNIISNMKKDKEKLKKIHNLIVILESDYDTWTEEELLDHVQ